MASRKDYIKTAQVLKELYSENCDQWGKIGKVDFSDVVISLAMMYQEDNPRFDMEKFLYASSGLR